ncbi:MAG: acyl-CoA synthetase [Acidimicrobiales bacterium]|nr:MAG: acyl-CoA synthetase [Acidimicrobiales bacterium]
MAITDSLRLARRLGWLDPAQVAATAAAVARWGPTLAAIYTASAVRHPRRAAVIDDRGSVTYAELDRNSSALAQGLRALGLAAGDHLGVLCSNHREFVEVSIATAKAGLTCVYLNTGFAAPQLGEVLDREGVRVVVCDAALLAVVESSGFDGHVVVADDESEEHQSIADVRELGSSRPLMPSRPIAPVLLTSGTTGTPKGARRSGRPAGLSSAMGVLERIPYRSGDVAVIPTPLFHAWGLAQLTVAASTGSTAVLVRRFAVGATLEAIESNRANVLAVVPVMLQRILAEDGPDARDTSSLQIVACSGSALPAAVATAWMDRYGENLYNVYGSTEVGQATLATPDDLRAAPGTAGRVIAGTVVEVVDADGNGVPTGGTGLIVVGSDAQFTEYTGGGTKERVRGLMSSGDVGYFDAQGRLFVTGRADDMIVSGGENVFPLEIEEVLLSHDDITDAAVVGVPDAEFGQRLAAFVVVNPGGSIDAGDVRAIVASRLARHKVPRDVTFVDELPRNTTGKLLRGRVFGPPEG